ncbi:hypothetical protein V6N13_028958 [Hibiscus sabdariffa]
MSSCEFRLVLRQSKLEWQLLVVSTATWNWHMLIWIRRLPVEILYFETSLFTWYSKLPVILTPGFLNGFPVNFIVACYKIVTDNTQSQVKVDFDYVSRFKRSSVTTVGRWLTMKLSRAVSIGVIAGSRCKVIAENIHSLFENLQFMDMKSVQIDDGETHDPSLAGDVKFGLIRMLLSPKLATKTAVVRTFTNIGWRRRLKFFRSRMGVLI